MQQQTAPECPVCAAASSLLDVVDLHKHCRESALGRLPPSGIPVYYARCAACGFMHAPLLYDWSAEQFREHIYNDGYVQFDPEYLETRPAANARLLHDLFGSTGSQFRHLDYGGGRGRLAELLTQQGWTSTSHDPMVDAALPAGRFELVTAFEVFEHVPWPRQLVAELDRLLVDTGMVLFSTLLSDGQLDPGAPLSWWYASPRNGHISLFSRRSLELLARRHGWQFGSINQNLHCFFRQPPAWAKRLTFTMAPAPG